MNLISGCGHRCGLTYRPCKDNDVIKFEAESSDSVANDDINSVKFLIRKGETLGGIREERREREEGERGEIQYGRQHKFAK